MSYDEWKLEDDLCRCCHSEGSFVNLSKGFNFGNMEEIYVDMLKYTLDIHIAPVLGALCTATYTICGPCILKLQEATTFKKQVLRCEEKFRDMYTRNFIKVAAPSDLEIKDEPPEENDDTQQDIPYMDSDEFHIKDDEHHKEDEEEELITKKVKHEGKKRSKKMPSKSKSQPKPKKPPKRGRPRKGNEVVANEKSEGGTSVEDYLTIGTDPRRQHSCKACEVSYSRISDLRYHVARAHLKQKFIKCHKCSETFMYHSQRKIHMYRSHSMGIPEKFQCEYCSRQFQRKNTLVEHMLDVHIERKCGYCESKFVRKKYLFHLNEKHGVPIPTCGICGLRTILESSLIRHQRNVHLRERTKACTICSKTFHTESNLKDHMITHRQEREFRCDVCGKDFARKECYRTHCRIHTGEKPFICRFCGIAYIQRASLRFHVRSRHGDTTIHDYHECFKIVGNGENKEYVCRYCGLECTDAEGMTSHINDKHNSKYKERLTSNDSIVKVHDFIEVGPRFNVRLDKVLSYVCHVCSKEYPNENSLKLHKKNYHILKKCPDCDLKFTRRNLRMHQHESHGVQIPTCGVCGYKNWVTAKVIVHQRKVHMNEKNVACDQCDMKFFDRISLGRHKIAHGTDRKFECSYCHKKYPRLNTLRLHEKIHTKVKDKICSICGQGFVQKASLNYHMKKHHPESC